MCFFFVKKFFKNQKKYADLGLLNILTSVRVYAAYHPSNIYPLVFVLSVFLRVLSVFILDGYQK